MRVAIFTDNDFDKVNGVTTTLTALVSRAPADVDPRIYTASGVGRDETRYLALRSVGMPIPFYSEMSMYVPRWHEYLRRSMLDGIDLIHLTTPGPLGLTALWVASKTGLPLVGSFHTDLEAYTSILSGSRRLALCMGTYMRWMYGRCQTVLVPSAATRQLMVDMGTPIERIGLWTRGVDTQLFAPERRSSSLRDRWDVHDCRPAMLYVGRLSREKGLDLLPALTKALERLGVSHRLVVAGDGPLKPWLMEQCPGAVFTGMLGRDEVADVFASSDVFLFPSRTDTAGNVVLEAQAAGVPVLVSNAGGPCENMVDGVTGVVCDGNVTEIWVEKATALLGDESRRRRMSEAARGYALTRRWDTALAAVYDTYRAAMHRPSESCAVVSHAV